MPHLAPYCGVMRPDPLHLRRLTEADWNSETGGLSIRHMQRMERLGLVWMLSPLQVPVEIALDSGNHWLCRSGLPRRRPVSHVLWAEHLADGREMTDLLELLESSSICTTHILSLPQPFWTAAPSALDAAQDLARSVAARRAALEALK